MDIRLANDNDINMLTEISALQGVTHESAYFERCFAAQAEEKREIFLAVIEERPTGYVILNKVPRYTLFRRLAIPEIQDLNVVPEHRQRGIATALVSFCEEVVRQDGFDHVGIGVGLHARFGPAQRLYIKLGYVPDGHGVVYDREGVAAGSLHPVDDELCLMMVKALAV